MVSTPTVCVLSTALKSNNIQRVFYYDGDSNEENASEIGGACGGGEGLFAQ